jgi:hypothetical protein
MTRYNAEQLRLSLMWFGTFASWAGIGEEHGADSEIISIFRGMGASVSPISKDNFLWKTFKSLAMPFANA